MTWSNFIAGFIGAFIGLVVYQLIVKPACLFLYHRVKQRYTFWRADRAHRQFLEGKEWVWAMWGTRQMTFNEMNGFFTGTSPFARGVQQALKELWPSEERRREDL